MEVTTEFAVITQATEANGESDLLLTVTGTVLGTKEKNSVGKDAQEQELESAPMDVDEEGKLRGKRMNSDDNEEFLGKLTKFGTPTRDKGEKQKEKRTQQSLISGFFDYKRRFNARSERKDTKTIEIKEKSSRQKYSNARKQVQYSWRGIRERK
jgi:hypothetical protein